MKKLMALLSVAGAAATVFGTTLDTTAFNQTCEFTLPHYRGASTLVDFPVAVRLAEGVGGFHYADCAADGADLRFTDADGNLIPHEIEYWNTSGESIVWVRIPALAGTTTSFRLYFGQKSDATLPAVNARDVWRRFVVVVHGGADLHDSSPRQSAVANGGGVSASMSSGIIGGGVNKPARNSIGVNVANPVKNKYLSHANRFTLSAWYRVTATGTDCIASSETSWNNGGFLLLCEGGNYMSCATSGHQGDTSKGKLVQNQWNHVGFSYVRSGTAVLNTYFDGALIYTKNPANGLGDPGRDNWTFGGYAETANGGNHIGDMDEMRIFDGIATADWMQAEYDSIKVQNFATQGTVAQVPTSPAVAFDASAFNRMCPIVVSGYRGASTLTDFPVAVRISEDISGFLYSECAANGADLRFADEDGNLFPHEIECWNPDGESIVWVRVPSLAGTSTRFRLYYNQKPSTTLPAVNPREVWNKYITVVHGGSILADSSAKDVLVFDAGGGSTPTMSSGVIGGGVSKPASATVGVNVSNPIRNALLTDTTKFTLSAWFRRTNTGTDCIVSSKDSWSGSGFLLLCEGGNYMSCAVSGGHQPGSNNGSGKMLQNQWNHVGFSYVTSGQLNTYFDGACIYSNNSARSLVDDGNFTWAFGSYVRTESSNHAGDMDEMRIYDGIATADWMQAEYDSIKVAAFAAPGSAVDISAGRLPNMVSVTGTSYSAEGIALTGSVLQFADQVSSFDLVLRWGDTPELTGGTVAADSFDTVGDTFTVTLPATTPGATYYYCLEMVPAAGQTDVTATSSVVFAGSGALWRPQTEADTWGSTVWKLGDTLFDFMPNWTAVFDGQEANYLATIQIPQEVDADTVVVTGDKNYTFAGAGAIAGKLVKSGTGTLVVPMAQLANPPDIEVTGGTLTLNGVIYYGNGPSGTARLTVGGGEDPAALIVNYNDFSFGRGSGGEAVVTVRANGLIRNDDATQWTRLGGGPGAHCVVNVEAGGEINSAAMMIGSMGAVGEARVAGTLTVRNNALGVGEGSASSLTLLPGGRIRARGAQAWANSSTWSGYTGVSTIHVDNGTFELYPVAAYASSTPILNTLVPVTYENAITFDIPTNGVSYCLASITNVTTSGTAHFIKTGGGTLYYNGGVGGLTGAIDVLDGMLIFANAFADDADIAINLAANASVGCSAAGGPAAILKRLPKTASGTLVLSGAALADTIDLTEYPDLKVALLGGGNFTGRLITADNHYEFDIMGGSLRFFQELVDREGQPATLTVVDSVGGGTFFLSSTNEFFTGGITVGGGAILALYGPEGNSMVAGPSGDIRLLSGSSLQLDAKGLGANFVQRRVTDDSDPAFIFVQSYAAECNVDISRFPNCQVGARGDTTGFTMTGTITPRDNVYELGGIGANYAGSNSGMRPAPMGDVDADTPAKVVIGSMTKINLSDPANTYSGGTTITNNGIAWVAGGDGFGKVPDTFDARNIVVDGGEIRQGNANSTLAATRGLWVGEQGMQYCPWGGYTLTVAGGLGGTGDIRVTDGGHLALTGAYNTWNGHLLFNYQSNLTIGDGEHCSWASTGGIEFKNASSVLTFNTDSDNTVVNDTFTGPAALRKNGDGVLTLATAPQLTGRTTVADGTLRLVDNATLTANGSIYNSGEIFVDRAGTATDVFAQVPIYGSGTIRFRDTEDVTIDRELPGLDELDVDTGCTATFGVPAPGTAISLANGATVKLAAGGAIGSNDIQLNDRAKWTAANEIQLTPPETYKGGTAYLKQKVDVMAPWEARFSYRGVDAPASPADGFTFVLQNKGVTAVGATGGALAVDTVTPSVGVGFNLWGSAQIGKIANGVKTGFTADINGINLVAGVDVVVTYDGIGVMTTTVTQGDKSYTQTQEVNLATALGASTAWVGFTAATGGAVCDQRITDFRFIQRSRALDLTVADDDRWQLNVSAAYAEFNGEPAFRLTDAVNWQSGTVVRVESIAPKNAFTIRGKYQYDGCVGDQPADGASIFLQTNGTVVCGTYGGNVGVTGISSAIGWKLNVYGAAQVVAVKNGALGAATTALNGIDFHSEDGVDFALSYRHGRLALTLTQGDKTATVVQDVDLVEYFGGENMYFSLGGGTGALNARQYVYGLSMTIDDYTVGGYGSLACEGTSAVKVAALSGATEVGTLALAPNAVVNVAAEGAANSPYTLAAEKVVFDGEASERTISLAANGTGTGTLKLGTVEFGAQKGNSLKVVGALAPLGEKIKISIPKVYGLTKLMDLTEATGVTVDDFELDSVDEKAELRLINGVLYAFHDVATIIFIR